MTENLFQPLVVDDDVTYTRERFEALLPAYIMGRKFGHEQRKKLSKENNLIQAGEIFIQLAHPLEKIFQAQLEIQPGETFQSWEEVHPGATLELRDTLDLLELEGQFEHLNRQSDGLLKNFFDLVRDISHCSSSQELEHLRLRAEHLALSFHARELPIFFLLAGDYQARKNNSENPGFLRAEVELYLMAPVPHSHESYRHFQTLQEQHRILFPEISFTDHPVFIRRMTGIGWAVLFDPIGQALESETYYLDVLGLEDISTAERFSCLLYMGHEEGHGCHEKAGYSTPILYEELVADVIGIICVLRSILDGNFSELGINLPIAIRELHSLYREYAQRPMKGADNVDGYKISGEVIVSALYESGLVGSSTGEVVEDESFDGKLELFLASLMRIHNGLQHADHGEIEHLIEMVRSAA